MRRIPAGVDAPERWHTTEWSAGVTSLIEDRSEGAEVAVAVLRGHLELRSPATAEELAEITGLGPSTVAIALADLEASGFALQGGYTTAGGEPRVVLASAACPDAQLLAQGRAAVEAVTPSSWCVSGCAGSTWRQVPSSPVAAVSR
ncbi:MAG: hypothetical protein R2716_08720 [Microthrixaceae bacterium]